MMNDTQLKIEGSGEAARVEAILARINKLDIEDKMEVLRFLEGRFPETIGQ